MSKMKNILGGINNSLVIREKKINELEDSNRNAPKSNIERKRQNKQTNKPGTEYQWIAGQVQEEEYTCNWSPQRRGWEI